MLAARMGALGDRETLAALTAPAGGSRRVLVRGVTVLSLDAETGDHVRGDVLITGSRITAVAPDLSSAATDGQAIVLEAPPATIAIPGLCDAHRHCWQNQFRRALCDVDDLITYRDCTHGGIALVYEPDDAYVGTLVSALGALDSGVTTVLDFAHNSRSAAHSDAGFRAYAESGIRAVHVSAPPNVGDWDGQWPADLERLLAEHGGGERPGGGRVSIRLGLDQRPRPGSDLIRFAHERGFATTIDGVIGPQSSAEVEQLRADGVLGPDVTLIHCTALGDAAWAAIAESGARVTLSPTSDQQIGIGDGVPPLQRALDMGIRPSMSVDVEISLSTDMFAQMRALLTMQRMQVAGRRWREEPDPPAMIGTRDVLEMATVQGAADMGLADVAGRLAPGLEADLVLIRGEDVNNLPLNSATGTVVLGTDPRNVDTVLVGGEVRKWGGELVGVDVEAVARLARESRDRVAARAGFELDPLGPARGWAAPSPVADARTRAV